MPLKEFEFYLRGYRSAYFELCPSLAHLRGYADYVAVARFQAGLLPSNLGNRDRTIERGSLEQPKHWGSHCELAGDSSRVSRCPDRMHVLVDPGDEEGRTQ